MNKLDDRMRNIKNEFANKFKSANDSEAYREYSKQIRGYGMSLFNMLDKTQLDYLFNNIIISEKDTVLDVGCGNGEIIRYILEKYKCKGIGIDILPKELIKNINNFEYIEGNIENIKNYKIKPTISLLIDSTYFVKNIQDVLYHLKYGLESKLYIFHSQCAFNKEDDRDELKVDNTTIAKILQELKINYNSIDFTKNEIELYKTANDSLKCYREKFYTENNMGLFNKIEIENKMGIELVKTKGIGRYLYTIE